MKLKFIKPALNLLMDEWNLGAKESGAPKNLCALIYLFELIEKSEYSYIIQKITDFMDLLVILKKIQKSI